MLDIITAEQNEKQEHESDCLKFILTRRPLDLLIEFAVTETPPGKIFPILFFKQMLSWAFWIQVQLAVF